MIAAGLRSSQQLCPKRLHSYDRLLDPGCGSKKYLTSVSGRAAFANTIDGAMRATEYTKRRKRRKRQPVVPSGGVSSCAPLMEMTPSDDGLQRASTQPVTLCIEFLTGLLAVVFRSQSIWTQANLLYADFFNFVAPARRFP
jgi:hypothetical protein